ncbi:MAG: hypothetical protein NTV43_13595 [Methylococcales bacterium]|nr:hypothetical protein [Methylococcales bacterium]
MANEILQLASVKAHFITIKTQPLPWLQANGRLGLLKRPCCVKGNPIAGPSGAFFHGDNALGLKLMKELISTIFYCKGS